MPAQGPKPSGGHVLRSDVDLPVDQEDALRDQLDPTQLNVILYTADGAISKDSGLKILAKTSAAAMTLAAPTAAEEGQQLILTTGSAFAHVVTFTGGTLWDGTAGINSTWTAAAVQGSSLHIVAYNLQWYVVAFNLGTIAP